MKTNNVHKSLVALALVACAAVGAHAEGAYVGGGLSAPNYNDTINGVGGGDGGSRPGGKLYGGYQITPNFAVEGGYFNLGHSHDENGGTAKAQGVYVDGVGSVDVAPKLSLLGSVGLAEARFQTPGGKDNSPALKLGVGVQYALTQNTALRVGYDHYRFTDAFDAKPDVGQTVLGVKVGF